MKVVQLILRKIIKTVATSCQILRLKCTKFDFGWGSAPDPAGGAYSAPPVPQAGVEGLLLRDGSGGKRGGDERGGDERGGEGGERRGGKGRGEGRKGEGRDGRGLSGNVGNVAEEAFCLKSAPGRHGTKSPPPIVAVQRKQHRWFYPASSHIGKRCIYTRDTESWLCAAYRHARALTPHSSSSSSSS